MKCIDCKDTGIVRFQWDGDPQIAPCPTCRVQDAYWPAFARERQQARWRVLQKRKARSASELKDIENV